MSEVKKNLVILVRNASDLNRIEDYLNKGYKILIHSKHGLRDFFILNNEPEIFYHGHEEKEIKDMRVIQIKNNPEYTETIKSLNKDGYVITPNRSISSAVMIKYKKRFKNVK